MTELFKSILCPVAFDELFFEALELGKNLTQQNHARLYVLNVISDFGADQGWEAGSRVSLQQQARMQLQGKVDYEFVIRSGEVADQILAAVRVLETDLIVIPTHARRGMKKLMLGSVAERIVCESPVPVLTLRAR